MGLFFEKEKVKRIAIFESKKFLLFKETTKSLMDFLFFLFLAIVITCHAWSGTREMENLETPESHPVLKASLIKERHRNLKRTFNVEREMEKRNQE
jgi:hypothetical protein